MHTINTNKGAIVGVLTTRLLSYPPIPICKAEDYLDPPTLDMYNCTLDIGNCWLEPYITLLHFQST